MIYLWMARTSKSKYWIQYPICCHFRHNHGDIQFLASRNSQKPKLLKQNKGHIQNQQLHVSNTHKMPLGLEYYTRLMLVVTIHTYHWGPFETSGATTAAVARNDVCGALEPVGEAVESVMFLQIEDGSTSQKLWSWIPHDTTSNEFIKLSQLAGGFIKYFFDFHHYLRGDDDPIWLIFFKWVETTN